jgi:hypothetical protein
VDDWNRYELLLIVDVDKSARATARKHATLLRSGKTSRPWQLTQPPQNKPRQFSDECEVEFPAAVDWAAKLQRLQFGSEVSQHWIAVPSEMSLFKYKRSMDELIPLTKQKTDQLCGVRVHRFSAELAFEVGVDRQKIIRR